MDLFTDQENVLLYSIVRNLGTQWSARSPIAILKHTSLPF